MTRVRSRTILSLTLVLSTVFIAMAQAQAPEGARRGFGRSGHSSMTGLMGLLRREQVRDALKLTDEQTTEVQEAIDKLGEEMRGQFATLRDIQDRDERREKMTEWTEQVEQKTREQLRDVLERGQMMRLYQIRMQVRPVVQSLANQRVAQIGVNLRTKDKVGPGV